MDDFTQKSWIMFLKSKDQYVEQFKKWLKLIEKEAGIELIHLRIDGGGEFISQVMKDFCADHSTTLEYSVPYTPEHNPISE